MRKGINTSHLKCALLICIPAITLSQPNYSYDCFVVGVQNILHSFDIKVPELYSAVAVLVVELFLGAGIN